MRWPSWLSYAHLRLLEEHKLARHEHYASIYAHTKYIIESE